MPDLPLSEDAAVVLALAGTAVRFADSPQSEAEQWLRILRMHGQVGSAMQALGVGEKPLEQPASGSGRPQRFHRGGENTVELARRRAAELAGARGAALVGTIDLLEAVAGIYGSVFDDALYAHGVTHEELTERLAGAPAERSAARQH